MNPTKTLALDFSAASRQAHPLAVQAAPPSVAFKPLAAKHSPLAAPLMPTLADALKTNAPLLQLPTNTAHTAGAAKAKLSADPSAQGAGKTTEPYNPYVAGLTRWTFETLGLVGPRATPPTTAWQRKEQLAYEFGPTAALLAAPIAAVVGARTLGPALPGLFTTFNLGKLIFNIPKQNTGDVAAKVGKDVQNQAAGHAIKPYRQLSDKKLTHEPQRAIAVRNRPHTQRIQQEIRRRELETTFKTYREGQSRQTAEVLRQQGQHLARLERELSQAQASQNPSSIRIAEENLKNFRQFQNYSGTQHNYGEMVLRNHARFYSRGTD